MKKLLHNELREAAIAVRDARMSLDDFFPKLMTLLSDHFDNLGLSENDFRSWCIPAKYHATKALKDPALQAALLKAIAWIDSAAKTTNKFSRIHQEELLPGESRIPSFQVLAWRLYFREREAVKEQSSEPIFYEGPRDSHGPIVTRRPWV